MKILVFMASLFVTQGVCAQADVIEKTFPFTNQFLDIDLEMSSDLIVKSWDKQEIYVKITYKVNDGKSNEAARIDIDNFDDRLALDIDFDVSRLKETDYCCCSEEESSFWNRGKRACAEISVEVMLPTGAEIAIETVTSDVTIDGMISNIDVETVTGVIDLSWAEGKGADIKMETVTGSLYTNIDFKRRMDRGLPAISGRKIKSTYKNGGKEVKLKSVTGAIYFRSTGK